MAEGAAGGGLDLRLPLMGVAGNVALEITGRTVVSGRLVLSGSAPALEKALAGKGLPFDVVREGFVGRSLGQLTLGASGLFGSRLQRKLADKLLFFEVATRDDGGIIERMGASGYIAIPVAFLWAVKSPDVFANMPFTSQFYLEHRNLQALSQ